MLLDAAAQKVAASLATEPVAQASVREIIGETYYKLDLTDEAEKQIRKAIELLSNATGGVPLGVTGTTNMLRVAMVGSNPSGLRT